MKHHFESEIGKLSAKIERVLRKLHAEAQADRCVGDISSGWDWPTLCAVKPEVAAELKKLFAERSDLFAAERSAGLANW